ncbi:general receptor for phosphoinositides 1-associated scaffold protein [Hippocampus comes]|uniref:general receptor for phosphoinositides 1-associated scaffold protein n=1 Tax=Hippocampus comes TaxID=109280 RepID=UPI00094E3C3A|nr:PREDICTED: general receptor for phosphoinositides 1-associated scaffold protein [Hippocampus comes]
MTFRRLKMVESNGPDSAAASLPDNDVYFPSSQSDSCQRTAPLKNDSSEVYNYKTLAYSGGTLPRNLRKAGGSQKWKPQIQSPAEPQRKVVVLERLDGQTFGFEIQTYGLLHQDQNTVEMCTFVYKVHDDSPAQLAGLRVGETIASVNEAPVEGFQHKEIVQLIKACGNTLRLETIYSDAIRKAELEARLQYLKQTLHEKWEEYRSLMVQEQRLVHGIVMSDASVYESLESAGVYGSLGAPSPAARRSLHGTGSSSSSASVLSAATEDDPLYQTCLYHADAAGDSDVSGGKRHKQQPPPPARKQRLRPASELFASAKTQLTRSASTRSHTRAPSSAPAAVDKALGFGSLQRKHRSFRRHLLKFIPGLNRPMEEEESKL